MEGNHTKTSLQARAEGQVKPKAYNAWDILALNDLIKNKIEDQSRRQREHQQRMDLRKFYDDQVEQKRRERENDQLNDMQLGLHIKNKVSTINKLADLDNTKRMLARGQVALENMTNLNLAKQKQELMENKAKEETIETLRSNNAVNVARTELQNKIKEQNRRVQLETIRNQIAENEREKKIKDMRERAEHLRDLELQQQMFNMRQQKLDEHLQSIKDRDLSLIHI